MNLDRAIDLVAKVVLAKAAMDAEWGFPDIGEHDWQRIQTRIAELTPVLPSTEDYHDAYRFLTERATTRSVT